VDQTYLPRIGISGGSCEHVNKYLGSLSCAAEQLFASREELFFLELDSYSVYKLEIILCIIGEWMRMKYVS
jgi:hypothetical protein